MGNDGDKETAGKLYASQTCRAEAVGQRTSGPDGFLDQTGNTSVCI